MRVHLSRLRRRRADQRGAAAVEMALLTPLLVLLIYGVIEFGVLFGQDLAMGNGAREGARYGAATPNLPCNASAVGTRDLIEVIQEASATSLLDTSDLTVEVRRGVSAASSSPVCSAQGSTNTQLQPNGACDGSVTGERLFVTTTWQRGLSIPFGPVDNTFTLEGLGVFTCEYRG